MSHLTNKSDINSLSAELLHKNSHYPAVIHCAYYSCVQLMKHITLFTLNKTEQDIVKEGGSSHEIIINFIVSHLKANNKDWRTFLSSIGQLKKLRVDADYKDVPIGYNEGNASLQLSGVILKHLRANIKI